MNWKALGITSALVAGLCLVMTLVVYCIDQRIYWPAYFAGVALISFCGTFLYLVLKDDL